MTRRRAQGAASVIRTCPDNGHQIGRDRQNQANANGVPQNCGNRKYQTGGMASRSTEDPLAEARCGRLFLTVFPMNKADPDLIRGLLRPVCPKTKNGARWGAVFLVLYLT